MRSTASPSATPTSRSAVMNNTRCPSMCWMRVGPRLFSRRTTLDTGIICPSGGSDGNAIQILGRQPVFRTEPDDDRELLSAFAEVSCAAAGETCLHGESSAERRRDYWRWRLREGCPRSPGCGENGCATHRCSTAAITSRTGYRVVAAPVFRRNASRVSF